MTDCMDSASDECIENERSYGDETDPVDEQNIFREFVDENILNEYMTQKGVLRGLMIYINIKENIEGWKKRKLNIAIIGNSGTGKSSLINALRGLKPGDDKAAPVGVTETTTEKRKYGFPNNENIFLWDLPGVGTQQFRRDEYLEKIDIREFDAFIIVSASRFTENEIWLAEEILKQKNFIFFVRTKVDIDLMNDKRDHPETFDAERCLEGMRMEIRKNFDKANIPMPKAGIFLVSSAERDSHDFQAMFEKLSDLLNSKGVSVQNLLQKYVEKVVMKERDAKKGSFIVQKGISAVSPLIVLGNAFAGDIVSKLSKSMYSTCKEAFCIDDKTLQEVSEEINMSVEDLKKRHLQFFKKIENKHRYFCAHFLDILPFPGQPFFRGYHFFKNKLHSVCDTLAEDEVTLIKLRLSRLVEQLTPL